MPLVPPSPPALPPFCRAHRARLGAPHALNFCSVACLYLPRFSINQVVQGSTRSISAASSGPERRLGDDDHSFTKRKGVVNTLGGAKDVTRVSSKDAEPLRRSDALKSGGIHTLSALPTGAAAPKGRSGSAPSDERSRGGIHTFQSLEHDSKIGLRKGDGLGGGAGASVTSAPGAKMGDLGGVRMEAPKKKPIVASKVTTGASSSSAAPARGGSAGDVARKPPIVRTLGGPSSGTTSGTTGGASSGGDARSDREKRLAYFEKMSAAASAGGAE
jgi:hypothetical protein